MSQADQKVNFRLTKQMLERLDALAAVENRSRSNLIVLLLTEALAAREAQKKEKK